MEQKSLNYLLYNIFLGIAGIFFLPYFLVRNLILRRPILSYFRNIPPDSVKKIAGRPIIWVQAVSVGETVVAHCILGHIRKALPQYEVVFTTTTPTGQAIAQKLLGDSATVAYFPFDFPFFVKRFVKRIKPRLFIMVETEIWPNAIRYARQTGAKIVTVNGRISDRSYKKYLTIASFLKEVLGQVDLLAMQTAEDANRIGSLGAPLARIMVAGNAKFDQEYPVFLPEQLAAFREQYGWSEDIPVFTAASTHRGEEEQIIEAYLRLTHEKPFYLILAPRHPNRADEVSDLLKNAGCDFARRTTQEVSAAPILLLDTFGELGLAYALADVIFVGGSLVNIGGHNVLEAAVQTKPVIYGPYMHGQRESKELLEAVDAGFTAKNSSDLVNVIKNLLADPELYQTRGEKARDAVLANKGAAANTAGLIAALMKE